jgi:hypothetical protein
MQTRAGRLDVRTRIGAKAAFSERGGSNEYLGRSGNCRCEQSET